MLIEFFNKFSAKALRDRAAREAEFWLSNPRIVVVEQTPWRLRDALAMYTKRRDKQWSLTDCASFEIMRQFNIRHALTADHHFVQAGYEALLPVVQR